MGSGSFTSTDWSSYSSSTRGRTIDDAFARRTIKKTKDPRTSFDPSTVATRESRDSADHPNATPVVLAFDVTGSMHDIPYYFVQEGLGTLMKEIYDRQPVSDPQIMCMAVGDTYYDSAPLQVTQFESDIRIAKQLEDIYLEGGGGGNEGESYLASWYFAATKTSTDHFEKRGKKGILFTIGDEPPLLKLPKDHIARVFGAEAANDLSAEAILEMVRKQYDVFHVVVEQGHGFSEAGLRQWNKLLGQGNVLRLKDYTKLSEVVTSAIQVNEGLDRDAVIKSWSGDTSLVVADALSTSLVASRRPGGGVSGPVRLLAADVA